jgi:hypothetical protein
MSRKIRPYTYLGTVQGMCRECRQLVPARIIDEGGKVFQEKLCPKCGHGKAMVAESRAWFEERVKTTVQCREPRIPNHPVRRGCPQDCGPCTFHANACHLPVFSITNACNMNCPICFTYNRADSIYSMSRPELKNLLDRVVERVAPLDLINITGGEPTLHPGLLDLLDEAQRPEIGRITMNTNGVRLATDDVLCAELARRGVYVILSFDTLNPETSIKIHGIDIVAVKLKALENLQKHGIGVTLLNVMIRDVNDQEIGDIIALSRRFSVVRSITVQTMTYTGSGGKLFQPRRHMTLDGAARVIEEKTAGEFRAGHFFPHPGAHPLCYSVGYFLKTEIAWRSLTELFPVASLRNMLQGGYLLQLEERAQDELRSAIDRAWADGADPELLTALKRLISKVYPPGKPLTRFERQKTGEENVLTIYVHAHMDEDTFDMSRIVSCPDQVPDPDGRMIPACAYNLFYRMKDPRFWLETPEPKEARKKPRHPGDFGHVALRGRQARKKPRHPGDFGHVALRGRQAP